MIRLKLEKVKHQQPHKRILSRCTGAALPQLKTQRPGQRRIIQYALHATDNILTYIRPAGRSCSLLPLLLLLGRCGRQRRKLGGFAFAIYKHHMHCGSIVMVQSLLLEGFVERCCQGMARFEGLARQGDPPLHASREALHACLAVSTGRQCLRLCFQACRGCSKLCLFYVRLPLLLPAAWLLLLAGALLV